MLRKEGMEEGNRKAARGNNDQKREKEGKRKDGGGEKLQREVS